MIEVIAIEATMFVPAGVLRQMLDGLARRQRTIAELALSAQMTAALMHRRCRDDQTVILTMPAHQAASLLALAGEQGVESALHPDVRDAVTRLSIAGDGRGRPSRGRAWREFVASWEDRP